MLQRWLLTCLTDEVEFDMAKLDGKLYAEHLVTTCLKQCDDMSLP